MNYILTIREVFTKKKTEEEKETASSGDSEVVTGRHVALLEEARLTHIDPR